MSTSRLRTRADPLAVPLAAARAELAAGIRAGCPPAGLLLAHTRAMDTAVRAAWSAAAPGPAAALLATGGYGRRELYAESDVDLAVLLDDVAGDAERERIEQFLRRLWDLGLKPGASVRTLAEARAAAAADAATFTALAEARRLAGSRRLAAALRTLLGEPQLWPAPAYLAAKLRERELRYGRYGGTAQRLEPSVKESPGGLRDLHTLCWIGARHLGQLQAGLADLERGGLIVATERRRLARAGRMLARTRLALHELAGRPEERLLFDLQPRVAGLLGYRPRSGVLAVESLMQDYYRCAATVAHVSNLVCALLQETPAASRLLSAGILARGNRLEFAAPGTPQSQPPLAFEIVARWQRAPGLGGLTAAALRALTEAAPTIGPVLRRSARGRDGFRALLQAPDRVAEALALLHRVGILDRYLPAFGRIAGRMQYDLFHVYTVDEHVLRVVAYTEDLVRGRFATARADLRTAAERIERPEVLFLAALFHDIAKGRGGDHSVLGAREVRRFALAHGLSAGDAELAAWLVRRHLALSLTAQKADLTDPLAIEDFARRVGDQRRLDYLYVLTAADVRATNPSLWNGWREALFGELYRATSRTLWRGLGTPLDATAEIASRKHGARTLLGGGNPAVSRLWQALGDDYFLQYNPAEIAWHTRALLAASGPPAVFMRSMPEEAGTVIAVYCTRASFAFSRVTATLAQLGLTIVAARCVPVGEERSLDTYVVLEVDATAIDDARRLTRIEDALLGELARDAAIPRRVTRSAPRQVRLFATPTEVAIAEDGAGRFTVVELAAGDRPGLLAAVGRAFTRCNVYLRTAKVMTVGERAEDVFHVTGPEGRPLGTDAAQRLEQALYEEVAAEG